MKTKIVLFAVALFAFSGCSSAPSMKDRPDELLKFPQWTQVAFVLETPISFVAIALVIWALNGGHLVKKIKVRSKETTKEKSE